VTAVIVWWVWVLFAVANLIDLMVEGGGHMTVLAAAILLMVTGVAYVTAQRPRVVAATSTLTVRNPLRDHAIPWSNVIRADVSDLLRIRFREPGGVERAVSAWAVHYSRRKQYIADTKARRAEVRGGRGGGGFGGFGGGWADRSVSSSRSATSTADRTSAEVQAKLAVTFINDYAAGIPQDEPLGTVTSRWNWLAIAALIVPALFLLIVALT